MRGRTVMRIKNLVREPLEGRALMSAAGLNIVHPRVFFKILVIGVHFLA